MMNHPNPSHLLSQREIQTYLNQLAAAINKANEARTKLSNHCKQLYGVHLSEVENETFQLACESFNQFNKSMSVEDFHKSMQEAMIQAGMLRIPDNIQGDTVLGELQPFSFDSRVLRSSTLKEAE